MSGEFIAKPQLILTFAARSSLTTSYGVIVKISVGVCNTNKKLPANKLFIVDKTLIQRYEVSTKLLENFKCLFHSHTYILVFLQSFHYNLWIYFILFHTCPSVTEIPNIPPRTAPSQPLIHFDIKLSIYFNLRF